MGVVRRYNVLQELENIDVLVDEFSESRYITISDFPDSFPQGKSSFLIDTSPHLKSGVELKIDIFDSEGTSIYHEPLSDHLEGTARRVSVEIHEDTAPGMATMLIAAELQYLPVGPTNFSDVEEVPIEWQNTYNLRFTKSFLVNQTVINTQPIKFYTQPKLTITEKVYGRLEVSNFGTLATASLGRIIGTPINNTEGLPFQAHDIDRDQGNYVQNQLSNTKNPPVVDSNAPIVRDPYDAKSNVFGSDYAKLKGIKDSVYDFRSVSVVKRNSPVDYPYNITVDSSEELITKYANGRIVFSNFTSSMGEQELRQYEIETPVEISKSLDAKPYSASIDELQNNKTALTRHPFTFTNNDGENIILPFEANATVEYEVPPSSSFDYTNTVSVADITLANLRTYSGEAFAAEILIRGRTSQDISDYRTLAFVPLQPPELMVNSNVVAGRIRTGYFGGLDGYLTAHEEINTYWNVSGSTNDGLDASLSGTVTASFDNSQLLDSVYLSGSIYGDELSLTFQLDDAYSFYLRKNVDYTLSFNAVSRNDRITDRAVMSVYISGSIASNNNTPHVITAAQSPTAAGPFSGTTTVIDGNDYGYRLGHLDNLEGHQTSSFGRVEHNFGFTTSGSAIVQFRVFDGEWNISDISVSPAYSTGFSPSYVNFLQQMPDEFLVRPDKFDFIVNFYDRSNNLADAIVKLDNVEFSGSNMVVVGTDNVLKGNMYIGGQSGDGIDMGGAEAVSSETGNSVGGSGYVRSIGYQGYLSASNASLGGRYGFMMFSGSVWPGSGDDYKGVGLELVGASGSLKFRTNPSVFDVQADSFFVGKTTTQFISGSGQKIEISSSNFHLSSSGDVNMTGTITANAGNIGGWTIDDSSLKAGAGNSSVTMSGTDQLIRMGSGSQFGADNVSGILFGQDTDDVYKFQIGEGTSYIYFDGTAVNIRSEDINVTASVFSVDVDVFKLSANNLFISSSHGGFISAGNPRPTGITGTNKGFYVQGNNPSDNKTKFLVGNAAGGHLSFDGDAVYMSSSAFYLGSGTQFISGSNGNLEISSSTFHVSGGSTIMSGKVTATTGEIGGLTIGSTKLSSGTAYEISSSTNTTDPVSFISSSGFKVSAGGQVTASALSLTGGEVGGLIVSSGEVSVGSILKLKDSGQITGSSVLFTGGKMGGWDITTSRINSPNGDMRLTSSNPKITIGTHTIGNGPGVQLGYDGSSVLTFFAGQSATDYIKYTAGTGVDIQTDTLKASGSNIILETPKFFLGKKSSQFVSGSNGNIEISSSQFHLTKEGNVTGSAILLGNKSAGQFLQFVNSTLTVQGAITADSIAVPSAAPTPSSSITSGGLLTTVSASIAGWNVTDEYIFKPISGNLAHQDFTRVYLSSTSSDAKNISEGLTLYRKDEDVAAGETKIIRVGGLSNTTNLHHVEGEYGLQIIRKQSDGSGYENIVYIGSTTQQISGWNINTGSFFSGTNIELNSANKYISINNPVFGNDGIQLQYNSGNPRMYVGDGSNEFLKFDGTSLSIQTQDAHISGSSITLETPKFFLGKKGSQYVSGSNNLIEISSSKFHLQNDGDVVMNNITASNANVSGKMTATTGEIGGFTIDSTHISADSGNVRLDSADAVVSIGSGVDAFGSGNRIYLDGAGTGSIIYQSDWSSGVDSWASSAVTQAGNIDSVTDGSTVKSNVYRLTVVEAVAQYGHRNVSLDVGQQYIVSLTYLIPDAGSTGGANGGVDGFRFAKNDSSDLGLGTYATATVGTWTTVSLTFTCTDATTNFRIYPTDGTSFSFGGGSAQIGDLVYISDFSVTAKRARFSVGEELQFEDNILKVSGSNIIFGTPSFRMGSSSNYISGSGGNIKIVSSGETTLSGSLVNIEAPSFFMGATGSAYISGSKGSLQISSSNFQVKASGDAIMAGKVTATSGFIGGWTINSDNIADASNLFKIDKAALQLSIKNHAFGQAGVQLKYDTSTSKGFFYVGDGANDHIQFNNDGVSIKTDTFVLDTTNLDISSAAKRITINNGSNDRIWLGEVDGGSTYGMKMFDGSGTGDANILLELGDGGNKIGGWEITATQITASNLILDKSGIIQTGNFASNTQGWRLTSANNGEAEFENVRIRGTLSTAVFEKETVNAVGGQLYIANSTALTGSTSLAATNATMSVVNVTGFTGSYGGDGEILSAKKISATGFATEYMFVQSSSRDNPASSTDLTGKLYVIRGYRSGSLGESGSLGDASTLSQSYEPGQVIVSTGRIGTGFIRLNANPNDTTTPYIDIVERTGSGVYDVGLKARLGDLSGLSSGLLYGETNPGFGLFTENVFLQGAITATTGSITGQLHISTDSSNKIKLGTDIQNNHDGIFINANNFWYTNGHFKTGFDADNYIHQSGSKLEIKSEDIDFQGSNFLLEADGSSGKFYLGTITSDSDTTGQGVFMDSGGHFRVIGNSTNQLIVDGGSLTMKSDAFDLTSTNLGVNTSRIFLGTITSLTDTSGTGFYLTSSGHFNIQNSSTEYLRNIGSGFELKAENVDISGSNVTIETPKFFLGNKSSQYVSGSNGNLEISSSAYHLSASTFKLGDKLTWDGTNLALQGSITITGGSGFATPASVSGSFDISGSAAAAQAGASASAAVGTAVAQAAIDAMESQVSLTSAGMDLLTTGGTPYTLATFGTTTKFFDGVASGSANKKLVLNASGINLYGADLTDRLDIASGDISMYTANVRGVHIIDDKISLGPAANASATNGAVIGNIHLASGGAFIYGAATDDYVNVKSDGVDVIAAGTDVATFGAISRVGDSANEHISMSSAGMFIKDGSDVLGKFTAGGAQIGSGSKPHVSASTSAIFVKQSAQDYLQIDSDSVDIYAGGTKMAELGSTVYLGDQDNDHVKIDSDSFDIKDNTTVHASFGATTTIGSTSGEHVKITSDAVEIKTDANTTALSASSAGLEMSGKVRATSGDIGGFKITSSSLFTGDLLHPSLNVTSSFSLTPINNLNSSRLLMMSKKAVGWAAGFDLSTKASSAAAKTQFVMGPSTDGISPVSNGGILISSETGSIYPVGRTLMMIGGIQYGDATGHGMVIEVSGSGHTSGTTGFSRIQIGNTSGAHLKFNSAENLLYISSSNVFMGATGSAYISASNGQMEISSSKFQIKPTGDLVVRKVSATEGTVGGWSIGSGGLTSPDTNIVVGTTGGNQWGIALDDAEDQTNHWWLDDDNNQVQFYVGSDTSYVRYDSAATPTLDIKVQSAVISGSSINIETPAFFMGRTGSAYISGSNGQMEISSSKFYLNAAGDVTMEGTVKATGGEIGGFFISQNEISSSLTHKRGLVLKPGDAIRGYGNSAHSTTTTAGKFSFGVGVVAPAADSDAPFSSDVLEQPAGMSSL